MSHFFESVPESLHSAFTTEARDAVSLAKIHVDQLIPIDNLGFFQQRSASALVLPDGAEILFKVLAQPAEGIYHAEITRTETDGTAIHSRLKLRQVFDGSEALAATFDDPQGPQKHDRVTPAQMASRLSWRIRAFTLDGQDLVRQGRLDDACNGEMLATAIETFTAYKRAGFPNRKDVGVQALPGPSTAEQSKLSRNYIHLPEI